MDDLLVALDLYQFIEIKFGGKWLQKDNSVTYHIFFFTNGKK